MVSHRVVAASLCSLIGIAQAAYGAGPDANQQARAIIQKSVAANNADWKAQPAYSYTQIDVKSKVDSNGHEKVEQNKTFEVLMIEGSPYDRLKGINNEPLSKAQDQQEQAKLKREIAKRQSESTGQRHGRISQYQGERSEEHLLMQQMVNAFRFRQVGDEQVNGVDCYVFEATPDPNYRPPVEKARVLSGMRGHLWIDKQHFHWVRVEAEVFQPVEFGFFLAKVKPGTSFELEQDPVGGVWLPKRFKQSVNASVLGVLGYRTKEELRFSDYHQDVLQAQAHSNVN